MLAQRLLLFDLDGTLLQPADPLHSRAFDEALAEAVGSAVQIDWTGTSGMVDRAILAMLLERAGLEPAAARRALTRACRTMAATYERGPFDQSVDRTLPGARALLERLSRLVAPMGLLTGNVGAVAWGRVRQAGLRHHFVAGAFGDEAMRRSTLVRKAIQRCGVALSRTFQPSEVFVIGDTPRDIRAAHLAGARCLAVATGHYSVEELRRHRPAAVVSDLTRTDEIVQILARL